MKKTERNRVNLLSNEALQSLKIALLPLGFLESSFELGNIKIKAKLDQIQIDMWTSVYENMLNRTISCLSQEHVYQDSIIVTKRAEFSKFIKIPFTYIYLYKSTPLKPFVKLAKFILNIVELWYFSYCLLYNLVQRCIRISILSNFRLIHNIVW